jgi:hypothetical protein
MGQHSAHRRRLDLHNISTDYAAAIAGRCGFTHLDTGRVCQLPYRHPGPCQLGRHLPDVGNVDLPQMSGTAPGPQPNPGRR